jgi:uncharacterized protein YdaU (DUF1376 family)
MAELPIMPLKTDALTADTQHMSTEEFGAYCKLLFAMWRHGGRIPNKPKELARIAGVTRQRWATIAEPVMRPMTITADGVTQKRLTSTMLDVRALRAKRVEAAQKSWSKRRANAGRLHKLGIS